MKPFNSLTVSSVPPAQTELPGAKNGLGMVTGGGFWPDMGATVTELHRHFPALPPKIWLALAVATLLARNVTPHRRCACGCGEFVAGKATLVSAACRKRAQRARESGAGHPVKQFNLVLQDEMPFKIPKP